MEFHHRKVPTSETDERTDGPLSRLLSVGGARLMRYARRGRGGGSIMVLREHSGVAASGSSMIDEHGHEIRSVHRSILHKRMELSMDRFSVS